MSYPAQFSPRHILAIWIADSNGTWIKTREFRSQNPAYRQHLTNFKNATGSTYNSTDAITGATLQSHITHTVAWDGRDVSGNLVADSTCRVCIEFTSANTTGKFYYLEFVKGPAAQNLTPANQSYFINISLTWTPDVTSVAKDQAGDPGISCYPNPFVENLVISCRNSGGSARPVTIFNLSGKAVLHFTIPAVQGPCTVRWNGSGEDRESLPASVYLISCGTGKDRKIVKVIKTD